MSKYRKGRKGPKCHYCHKIRHIQQNCTLKAQNESRKTRENKPFEESHQLKHRANGALQHGDNCSSSVSDGIRLIVCYALIVC